MTQKSSKSKTKKTKTKKSKTNKTSQCSSSCYLRKDNKYFCRSEEQHV